MMAVYLFSLRRGVGLLRPPTADRRIQGYSSTAEDPAAEILSSSVPLLNSN